MIKATITNCKSASVLADPINPDTRDVVIGTLKSGDTIMVDVSTIYWSWDDRAYYKCDYGFKEEEGYINTGVVKI